MGGADTAWAVRVWRREPRGVWWMALLVLGGGALAFVIGVGIRDAAHRPGGVSAAFYVWLGAAILFAAFMYRMTLYPKLLGGSSGLVIKNAWKTHRVEWAKVEAVAVTGAGRVHVLRRSASRIIVQALQIPRSDTGQAWGDEDRPQAVAYELKALRPDLEIRDEYLPGPASSRRRRS